LEGRPWKIVCACPAGGRLKGSTRKNSGERSIKKENSKKKKQNNAGQNRELRLHQDSSPPVGWKAIGGIGGREESRKGMQFEWGTPGHVLMTKERMVRLKFEWEETIEPGCQQGTLKQGGFHTFKAYGSALD